MKTNGLPRASGELLEIPSSDVPEVVRNLLNNRSLSPLVQEIHREMASRDPKLRQQARKALRHLGFPD